jgi:hypothetical protein
MTLILFYFFDLLSKLKKKPWSTSNLDVYDYKIKMTKKNFKYPCKIVV